jgi:asparagine synthetase B (glutamine-hydrolysing)
MDKRDYLVNGFRKYPLRNAMRGLVPDDILFRKDKDAFNAPIFDYIRAQPIRDRIRELFKNPRTSSIFSPNGYLREYEKFLSGKASDRLFLLHGFILEEWSGLFNVEHG